MILFEAVILILFLFILGKSILGFIARSLSLSFPTELAVSFGLGCGFVILQLLLFSLLTIRQSPVTLLFPPLMIIGIWLYHLFRTRGVRLPLLRIPSDFIDRSLLVAIGSLILFAAVEGQLRVPMGWDAIATWLFQAKGFYTLGGFTTSFYQYAQIDSPPGIGLLGAYFYQFLKTIADREFLLVFSIFYFANCVLLYDVIKSETSQRTALVFVFFYASLQSVLRQAGRFEAGYVDLPLSYFFLAATALLVKYREMKQVSYLMLGGLFAGVAVFIKNEASVFFLGYLVLSLVVSFRVSKRQSVYLMWGVLLFLFWQLYKLIDPLFPSFYERGKIVLERFDLVSKTMASELFRIDRWNLFWITMIVALVLRGKKMFLSIPSVLFLFQLGTYFVVFLLTPLDPVSHIQGSFDRLLLQIAPLAMWTLAVSSYAILKKQKAFTSLIRS